MGKLSPLMIAPPLIREKLFDAGTDLDATRLARESLMELTID